MSTTLTTTDLLPSSVPKLLANGLNWTAFSMRFQDAVEAKGLWGHFDGTTTQPAVSNPPTTDEQEALTKWVKDERTAKALLTHRIPDSTLIRVHGKASLKDRWELIVTEFSSKGAFAQADLRTHFMESRCPDRGNVREFLDGLRVKKEELATYGVGIEEKDYRSTIIKSLPPHLSAFASNLLAGAKLYSSTKTIDPDELITLVSEEYERHAAHKSRRPAHASGKAEDRDEAMFVSGNGKGKRPERKPKGTCWNCGDKGHYKNKCPKPDKTQGDKKRDSPKGAGSANAAVESDDEEGAAFFADYDSDDELPQLLSNCESDSDDDCANDWFSEVSDDSENDRETEELPIADESDTCSLVSVDQEDAHAVCAEVNSAAENLPQTEVYDSGCTRHITPYRDAVTSYTPIPPKSFRAANRKNFNAVGMGEMRINVPNGATTSQLNLTEVLYSPDVGYTLVSIGRLNDAGFAVSFADGKCVIRDRNDQLVGTVLKTGHGLYRVSHEQDIANSAKEVLTLDQFHRRMGHISPEIARRLVTKGFVTGVKLETLPSGEPFFCESCVYAKATRKPLPKIRDGTRATAFGQEVHSDLWGPAPVTTKAGKRYYITFTDDMTRLTHLYLLRSKDEASSAYKEYEMWCDTQLNARVKTLHSDRGGEYLGKEFTVYLKSKGTAQKLTVHNTPQQNGVAERRNRTIVERVRALLHSSGLPRFLWGEAARHVVWLMNRTTTKAVDGKTPHEAAFGDKPNLKHVREWGERVWVRTEGGDKLGGRVSEGRWIGIDERSKGFRIYWPEKKSVTVERNVHFDNSSASASRLEGENWQIIETETNAPANQTPSSNAPIPTAPSMPHTSEPQSDSDAEAPAKRLRKPSQRVKDILEGHGTSSHRPSDPVIPTGVQMPSTAEKDILEGEGTADWMLIADEVDGYVLVAETSEVEAIEPRSLAEAKRRPDWHLWESAIHEELAVLRPRRTLLGMLCDIKHGLSPKVSHRSLASITSIPSPQSQN
jgi:hypothetical protein